MSKAVLVMDMPESCFGCNFLYSCTHPFETISDPSRGMPPVYLRIATALT